MGATVNTGLVSATITQNITGNAAIQTVPGIPSGATAVVVNFLAGTAITASAVSKYTVTATKTFYLMGCSISNSNGLEFSDNGTAKITLAGVTAGDIQRDNLMPTAYTTNVSLKGLGVYTAYGSFWGYEL